MSHQNARLRAMLFILTWVMVSASAQAASMAQSASLHCSGFAPQNKHAKIRGAVCANFLARYMLSLLRELDVPFNFIRRHQNRQR